MFASAIGFVLAGGILLLIFFASLGVFISSLSELGEKEKITKVKDHSVLHMEFDKPIVDRAERNPFNDIDFGPFQGAGMHGLNEILDNLEKAKTDKNIEGIFLDLSSIQSGMSNLEEVRNALIDFKESGKWIVAYGENLSQSAYYLATVSDELYIHPEGEIMFKGLNAEVLFYKGLLDKIEVEMQVVRGSNNKFKSAVEPFIYTEMSDENRKQMRMLLDAVWGEMLSGVSDSRSLEVGELNNMADDLISLDVRDAEANGMVDGLLYRDEIIDLLKQKANKKDADGEVDSEDSEDESDKDDDDDKKEEKLRLVEYSKYQNARPDKDESDEEEDEETPKWKIKQKIAVIYAQGAIQSGKGDQQTIGSETLSKAIKDARKDTTVKAIVLRVNSPGGSALASDVIWRETQLAKEEKPLIVSMGDYAASGGYYISAGADKIFATPSTITGSIGVFGLIPNAKGMVNSLGITVDQVSTNENSGFITSSRSLTDFEYRKLQKSVDRVYDTFLSRVAEGRGMEKAMVDSIGQGRVWSGKDALQLGLVDTLGGLDEAIEYAAEVAGLDQYREEEYPKQKDPFEELMKGFSVSVTSTWMEAELGELYPYYNQANQIRKVKGVQARLPFFLQMN